MSIARLDRSGYIRLCDKTSEVLSMEYEDGQ